MNIQIMWFTIIVTTWFFIISLFLRNIIKLLIIINYKLDKLK